MRLPRFRYRYLERLASREEIESIVEFDRRRIEGVGVKGGDASQNGADGSLDRASDAKRFALPSTFFSREKRAVRAISSSLE